MDKQKSCRAAGWIILFVLVKVDCQSSKYYSAVPESSPCPQVFAYEVDNSIPGRWYGLITLTTDVTLYGVWINVILDKQADALASSFGEVSSEDNRDFKLENTRQTLTPDSALKIRIYANYNSIYTAPKLRSLRLNGREICANVYQSITQQYERNSKRSTSEYNINNYYTSSTVSSYGNNGYSSTSNNGRNQYDDARIRTSSPTRQHTAGFNNGRTDDSPITPLISHDTRISRFDDDTSYGQVVNYSNSNKRTASSQYDQNRDSINDERRTNNDNARTNYNNDQNSRTHLYNGESNNYNRQNTNNDNPRRDSNQDDYARRDLDQDHTRTQATQTANRRINSRNFEDDLESRIDGTSNRRRDNYPVPATTPRYSQVTPHHGSNDYYGGSTMDRVSPLSPSMRNSDRRQNSYNQRDIHKGTSSVSTQTYQTTERSSRDVDNRGQHHSGYDSDDAADDDRGHSRKPNRQSTSYDYFEGDHKIPDAEKINPTPISHITYNNRHDPHEDNEQSCGRVATKAAPLIVSGETAKEGQWPWHVALYQSQTVDSKYICGGSLVSLNHVLTAAHCVTRKLSTRAVNPQTLTLYLGKYNLRKASDGVQIMLVRRISVHPDYNATSFFADLAILKMTQRADYTDVVRPVCLWRDEERDLSYVVGKEGSVVGWGFDENESLQEDLAVVRMPVVKQTTCLWSFSEFFSHFTSNHSYCAGYANGTSVCNGDSGGGMVFPSSTEDSHTETSRTSKTVWHLRGVVSISVARQNDSTCDPYHYVVFSDVAQYLDWIKQNLT